MIRLFTTIFSVEDKKREQEYRTAMTCNLDQSGIDEIHVFEEGESGLSPSTEKGVLRKIGTRPHYSDFFSWINELAGPDDISIIANTDIFFEDSITAVDRFLKNDECYALSRWDAQPDGSPRLFDRNDSQDAWIFRGPIQEAVYGDFPLGVPRCDNRLLHELRTGGYHVRNPAFSIRALHLHDRNESEINYEDSPDEVPRPYAYAYAENLCPIPLLWWHNLRHPDQRLHGRFDRRKVARSLPGRVLNRIRALITRGTCKQTVQNAPK